MASAQPPHHFITYGPEANCTLALCPVEWSVYKYRPSVAANAFFMAVFGIIMLVQAAQLVRYRTWWFGGAMILGCLSEIIGYSGRIILYNDPFSFNGFLLQIICVTFAPVFFTAAIYFTLSVIVVSLDRTYSRVPPKFFYYFFIASDVIALVLQAYGGATSSSSSGTSQVAVDVSLAGLSWQVISLFFFCCLSADYVFRYCRGTGKGFKDLTSRGKVFAIFGPAACILIEVRCAYRIAELKDGYSGDLIHDEPLFIALEGVVIVIAAIFLCIAHPGWVFGKAGDLSGVKKTASHNNTAATSEKPLTPFTSDDEMTIGDRRN